MKFWVLLTNTANYKHCKAASCTKQNQLDMALIKLIYQFVSQTNIIKEPRKCLKLQEAETKLNAKFNSICSASFRDPSSDSFNGATIPNDSALIYIPPHSRWASHWKIDNICCRFYSLRGWHLISTHPHPLPLPLRVRVRALSSWVTLKFRATAH